MLWEIAANPHRRPSQSRSHVIVRGCGLAMTWRDVYVVSDSGQ